MPSRSRSGSHRSRITDQDDYPPLPPARLPTLRTLAQNRHQDSTTSNRPQPRAWSVAALRAERIRNLENHDALAQRPDESYHRRSGRAAHLPRVNFADLDRSLHEANLHLRALLELNTIPALLPNPEMSGHIPVDHALPSPDDNRRHKRRKLSADRFLSIAKGLRYGKYGQVEPGRLRMEMVSCDGGMFSDGLSYAAENILRDDDSVYCTKGNRCNIVLRHQDSAVFTLQELIIKAPTAKNYSHPIGEGMVFVAMDQDDLFKRTAQYLIQYNPRSDDPSSRGPSSGHDLRRQLEPPRILSIQHHDDGSTSTYRRHAYVYRDNDADPRTAQMPPEFAENLPDFRVTTYCSDDEDEDDYDHAVGGMRFYRRAPNRIGALPFENADSESDADDVPIIPLNTVANESMQYAPYSAANHHEPFDSFDLSAPRPPPSNFSAPDPLPSFRFGPARHDDNTQGRTGHFSGTQSNGGSLADAWEAHISATQDAVRAINKGYPLLAPHARFSIEKNKSKCTIRFDPPVSGRFILLKMWSSHQDPASNIDIQSVTAHGFSGPRYFPSVALR